MKTKVFNHRTRAKNDLYEEKKNNAGLATSETPLIIKLSVLTLYTSTDYKINETVMDQILLFPRSLDSKCHVKH